MVYLLIIRTIWIFFAYLNVIWYNPYNKHFFSNQHHRIQIKPPQDQIKLKKYIFKNKHVLCTTWNFHNMSSSYQAVRLNFFFNSKNTNSSRNPHAHFHNRTARKLANFPNFHEGIVPRADKRRSRFNIAGVREGMFNIRQLDLYTRVGNEVWVPC